MDDWKQRLIKERNELKGRHSKLVDFLASDLHVGVVDPGQLVLMGLQEKAMYLYLDILDRRIIILKDE